MPSKAFQNLLHREIPYKINTRNNESVRKKEVFNAGGFGLNERIVFIN